MSSHQAGKNMGIKDGWHSGTRGAAIKAADEGKYD